MVCVARNPHASNFVKYWAEIFETFKFNVVSFLSCLLSNKEKASWIPIAHNRSPQTCFLQGIARKGTDFEYRFRRILDFTRERRILQKKASRLYINCKNDNINRFCFVIYLMSAIFNERENFFLFMLEDLRFEDDLFLLALS